MHIVNLAAFTVGAALLAASAAAADAEHGKQVFQLCAACHSEGPDATGPNPHGVLGRKSAALDDFRYSNAMKSAKMVWDETNLRDYINYPQAVVAGNHMPFVGLSDPKEVDDLIAYLKVYK